MVAISNVPMFFQISDSIEYSCQARKRDKFVESYQGEETIEIEKLPPSHLMLSYFCNDETWLENVYLPYFQKEYKVKLVELQIQ